MDVIVENRKTGKRKQMTAVMAKLLESKYRIVPEALTTESSKDFTPPIEKLEGIEKLRAEYFELFGQQPHHRLGEVKLKELIEKERTKISA